jgi:type VI secretion system secreted protein Hcp
MARGDMFLKVEGARSGVIKGEAHDPDHREEIDVFGWSWGMQARSALAAAGPSSKTLIEELDIVKRVDSASTALMSAIRTNEPIRKATLTVRKAGSSPLEYVKIILESARVTSLHVFSEDHELSEKVSFGFQKISVEYAPQGSEGGGRGRTTFETEMVEA